MQQLCLQRQDQGHWSQNNWCLFWAHSHHHRVLSISTYSTQAAALLTAFKTQS